MHCPYPVFSRLSGPYLLVLAASASVVALGSLVLMAWHLQLLSLIRILPNDSVMVYNTALCFFLTGLGLYAATSKRPRLAVLSGSSSLVISVLTLGEYGFGLNLGIDQALMTEYIVRHAAFPGRMALATAIGFMLCSLSILLMSWDQRETTLSLRRIDAITLAGTIVTILGVTTILLFMTGLQVPYGWGRVNYSMAMPTAVGFSVLGMGIISWTWQWGRTTKVSEIRELPFVVAVGGITATLLLWQALLVQEHRTLERTISSVAAHVAREINTRMEARMLALARLATRQGRWELRSPEEWVDDAEMIVRDYPGFQAISWIDDSLQVRGVAPVAGNEALFAPTLMTDTTRRVLFEQVRNSRTLSISPLIDLPQGRRGFVVYLPIAHGEQFVGVIGGGFHADVLFSTILHEIAPGYSLVVMAADTEVYRRLPAADVLEAEWGQNIPVEFAGAGWHVRIWPEATTLAKHHTLLPNWALGSGFFATLLICVVVALAQERHNQARIKEIINQELIRENAKRKEAEERVNRLNTDLEQRVRERTTALARANAALRQLAYVSAHDLQEPVRMVSIYTQLLASRYQGKFDEEADRFIQYTVEGATRIHLLLTDLLAYLQLDTAEQDNRVVNCEEILATVLNDLQHIITDSDAVITHDPLPTVYGNGAQLALVFHSLIENALTFRLAEPPQVHLWAERQDGMWMFAVQDNGIGIDPAYAERIFLMFERLHSQAEYPGTGMGLTLCKKIIERHGGKMWVKSQLGQGATFYFTVSQI